MNLRRSIDTKIWGDAWVETLQPNEKLLWLYLLTNANTNMLGIYEMTMKRASYETGITEQQVESILITFESANKAFYWDRRIFLPNWMKNQAMNPNMGKSAKKEYDCLGPAIKEKLKENGFESFERLSKGWESVQKDALILSKGMKRIQEESQILSKDSKSKSNASEGTLQIKDALPKKENEKEDKVENEEENEAETESELKLRVEDSFKSSYQAAPTPRALSPETISFNPPTEEAMSLFFSENGYNPSKGKYAWLLYKAMNWRTSRNQPIIDWKETVRAEFFLPENLISHKKVFG